MPSLAPSSTLPGGMTAANNAWNYVIGQCTRFVASVAAWIPAGLGNAKDWLRNARAKGLETTSIPTVNAVAVYNPGGLYDVPNGHVALVTAVAADLKSFTVREMNFSGGPGVEDTRVSTLEGVQGFILPPGVAAGSNGVMSVNLNPLDIPGAIGNAASSVAKSLIQIAYIIAGLVLFIVGLWLTVKAEGGKLPTPVATPLRVIKAAKEAVA